MIRDPSDGSVRDVISNEANKINQIVVKPDSSGIVPSGLPPESVRPQMIAKLEKSREWLKTYHERKGTK